VDREPFVIIESPERRAPAVPDGRRPEILLVDADAAPGSGLSPLLFEAGFDVFRTARRESALELIQGRSSILMALVRLDQPSLESGALIRDLIGIRPGLWIGMLGDWPDRLRAEEGYRAGADDLIPTSAPVKATADRLALSVTGALRKRERVERHAGRARRFPLLRRQWRKLTMSVAGGVGLGILLAILTQAWQDFRSREELRLDRLLAPLEATDGRRETEDRRFDRWSRSEALDLQRRMHDEAVLHHREQREESRFDRLFRAFVPQYPRP
jgi:DNA-binding response OmpR family regulator